MTVDLTPNPPAPSTGRSEPAGTAAAGHPAASRRRVLGLAAGLGAVGVLAACGDSGETTSGDGSTGSQPSASSSPGPEETAAGGALVATADVPVGGGVILEDRRIVVTQPTAGSFKAFSATCTHQACIVASVKDGTISCACHGSAFSATDGSVRNGPATRALKEVPVTVEGDEVVAS